MSERLRLAYLNKYRLELSIKLREKSKEHLTSMEAAGGLFNARHEIQGDVCEKHGGAGIVFVETPEFIHYGKMVCQICTGEGRGGWIRWVAFPVEIAQMDLF